MAEGRVPGGLVNKEVLDTPRWKNLHDAAHA
jgi:hypothetical protein